MGSDRWSRSTDGARSTRLLGSGSKVQSGDGGEIRARGDELLIQLRAPAKISLA
ncbi:Uncharacterized protein DAT39_007526, partial [Clarias magur]